MAKILDPNQSYTFSKFFELNVASDKFVAEFGYRLVRTRLSLPQYSGDLDRIEDLKGRIEELLPYVDLSSETARREIIVSKVVSDLVHYTKAQLRIEFPIKVTNQLQGYLDYLLESDTRLLVIEAKKEDFSNGFVQLSAELIALDQSDETSPDQPYLIGTVTNGTLWQFGVLHRADKLIEQGLDSYRVPDDLDPLMRILIQALIH
jgi:hypothetical protein